MKHTIHAQCEGEFRFHVRSPRGDRFAVAPNIITNAGLDQFFSGGSVFGDGSNTNHSVQIGTGSNPPAATDTSLQNKVQHTISVQTAMAHSYTAGPPDYIQVSVTYRFALGALNSLASGNFTEVGIGWLTTGGLWSRALITDGAGSPTPLAVFADEQLDVTYVCRIYPQTADATGSITLDGSSYNFTVRPSYVSTVTGFGNAWRFGDLFKASLTSGTGGGGSAYSDTIKARTTGPSVGAAAGFASVAFQSYSNGSFARVIRYTYDLNNGNVAGGIKTVVLGKQTPDSYWGFTYQVEFSPVIPKDATKRLTLDLQFSLTRRP